MRVIATDAPSDLALLSANSKSISYASFRAGRSARLGEDIIVTGYPLASYLNSGLNVTEGNISALRSGNLRHLMQITAAVQPGNSGGPVLDRSGNVVGVVVSKLDALKYAKRTGVLPENINFAIKAETVRIFLDSENVRYKTARPNRPKSTADIASDAREYTILVECLK